ncbi:MAG: zf-HC2 domain-containing protein [Syntrophomonadaceae bacterium]|nr:zf-HC2 domain-containing protein [Syntrophomonadaceae bacterium]
MKCQLVDRFILDYCDNTLSPDLTREIEEHLKECAMCRDAVSLLKAENLVLYNLEKLEPSADFTDKVMENIKANMVAAEPQKSSKKTKIPYYMLLPVAAVLLFMLTINLPDVFNMGAKRDTAMDNRKMAEDITLLQQEIHIAQNNNITTENIIDEEATLGDTEAYSYSGKEDSNSEILRSSSEEDSNNEEVFILNQEKETSFIPDKLELSSRSEIIKMASLPNENQINLQIQNIPEEYTLFEVIDNQENSITYCYTDEDNQVTLDITISELVPDVQTYEETNEQTSEEENLEKTDSLSIEPQGVEESISPLNVLSYILNKDNKSYIISIKSNLSKEDINKFYSSITFTK